MIIYTGDYKLCFTEILEKGYDINSKYQEINLNDGIENIFIPE